MRGISVKRYLIRKAKQDRASAETEEDRKFFKAASEEAERREKALKEGGDPEKE